ncbi:MAG: acyl-CoA thioesterase [Candidatus Wallbacteria bacterium]|nr:acyl-CoA thioesterase [Candidatus Wallbacteria bacterium]
MEPGLKAGKPVCESKHETTQQVLPGDTNPLGTAFGGTIMAWIDIAGAVAAMRHARSIVVTASIDEMHFIGRIKLGDLVILSSSVNFAGRTSMEVGVRVDAENPVTGERQHTGSCYVTYVAIDEHGKPIEVPPVIPQSDEEKRRHREAKQRRSHRLQVREARRKRG